MCIVLQTFALVMMIQPGHKLVFLLDLVNWNFIVAMQLASSTLPASAAASSDP